MGKDIQSEKPGPGAANGQNVSGVHSVIKETRELLYQFPFYIFVIVLVYSLVISVNEITARQSMLRLVESLQKDTLTTQTGELEKVNNSLTTQINDLNQQLKTSGTTTNIFHLGNTTPDSGSTEDLQTLQTLKTRLLTLSAVGAGPLDTNLLGENIMKALSNLSNNRISYMYESPSSSTLPSPIQSNAGGGFWGFWNFIESALPFQRLRSDNLLAVAMTCAGIIGAFTAAYRKRKLDPDVDETSSSSIVSMTVEAVIIGCGSGLLTFLAVKGGKSVFFLELNGEINAVNPYSGAFAGFIAGLFTEKLFALLSELVDGAIKKIRGLAAEDSRTPSKPAPANDGNGGLDLRTDSAETKKRVVAGARTENADQTVP